MSDYYDEAVPRSFFRSEYAQDEMVRQTVNDQARALSAMGRDASRMRKQLENITGNVERRLGNLTRAFYAFVELDAIRAQLAAFPDNAKARRFAALDLEELVAGRRPEPRPDVPGYWLPAAVAALGPDGEVDPERAAIALERGDDAEIFLVAAQSLLGHRADLVPRLLPLLDSPRWSPVQAKLWTAVLQGAFGQDALARLEPILRSRLAQADTDAWKAWVGAQSTVARRQANSVMLEWVEGQLSPLAADPAGPDHAAWGLAVRESADEDAAPVVTYSTDEPTRAAAVQRATLGEIISLSIESGDRGERDLLERAEQLRRQIADPDAPAPEATDEVEEGLDPLQLIRASAMDPTVSLRDRRLLWKVMLDQLRPWLDELTASAEPSAKEVAVVGISGLTATADGLDEAQVRAKAREISREAEQDLDKSTYAKPVMIAGIALVVTGFALSAASAWFLALVVLGFVLGYWGYVLLTTRKEAKARQERQLADLDRNVASAIDQSKRDLDREVRHWGETREGLTRVEAAIAQAGI